MEECMLRMNAVVEQVLAQQDFRSRKSSSFKDRIPVVVAKKCAYKST